MTDEELVLSDLAYGLLGRAQEMAPTGKEQAALAALYNSTVWPRERAKLMIDAMWEGLEGRWPSATTQSPAARTEPSVSVWTKEEACVSDRTVVVVVAEKIAALLRRHPGTRLVARTDGMAVEHGASRAKIRSPE